MEFYQEELRLRIIFNRVQLINLYRKNHVEYPWTHEDRKEQKVLSVMLGIIILTLSFLSISSYILHLPNANAQNNDNTINLQNNQSIADKVTIVKVLANSLGQSLNNSAAHLKITSMSPQVGSAQYAD
ncbi:MAG TPA: hypothetical protein VFS97_10495, partial [Nitrososphaeraceae archaeon]|nr:hypothetical protein [Nitrososphaeraceae archaeon]